MTHTTTQGEKNWEERFDEKFKCIQSDCDGARNIPVGDNENGWHAEQCQFHAEYLFPLKEFIASELHQGRQRFSREFLELIKNGGTGDTILTIQHNGETFVNERQLSRAITHLI